MAGLSWNPVKQITLRTIQKTTGVSWEGFLVGCLCQLMQPLRESAFIPGVPGEPLFPGATVVWEKPLCRNKGGLYQPRPGEGGDGAQGLFQRHCRDVLTATFPWKSPL